MNWFALDTNIVSAHFGKDAEVGRQILAAERLYLPSVVLGELYYGAYHGPAFEKHHARIQAFLGLVDVISVDDDVAKRYEVKAALARAGTLIPENDIWIAAMALHYDLTLATRDGHFSHVVGLKTTPWQ